MADPTARFVLTASDQTRAAFASVDRNMTKFTRSVAGTARSVRALGAAFGLSLTVRAFAGWVSGALKAAEATGEHAKEIKAAQEAMAMMKKSSDELAVSVGMALAPAFVKAAGALVRLREGLFPTQAEAIFTGTTAAVRKLKDEILTIETALADMEAGKTAPARGESQIANMERRLASLRTSVQQMEASLKPPTLGADEAASFEKFLGQIQYDEEMRRLAEIAKGQDFSPGLEAYIDGLKEAESLTASMRTDVEKQIDEWDRAKGLFDQGMLPGETLRRLDEEQLQFFNLNEIRAKYKAPLKELESEAAKTAKMIGASFQDAFTGWILGTEHSFRDMLKRMAVEMATSALFTGLASMFPGGSFFSNFFGGSRASGGSTRSGMVYRVHPGEAFFAPGMDGHVGAAAGGGGPSAVVYQTNHFNGGNSDEMSAAMGVNNERMMRAMEAKLRQERGRRRF